MHLFWREVKGFTGWWVVCSVGLGVTMLPNSKVNPRVTTRNIRIVDTIYGGFKRRIHCRCTLYKTSTVSGIKSPFPRRACRVYGKTSTILFSTMNSPGFSGSPATGIHPRRKLLTVHGGLNLFTGVQPMRAFGYLLRGSPLHTSLISNTSFLYVHRLAKNVCFKRGCRSGSGTCSAGVCAHPRVRHVLGINFRCTVGQGGRLAIISGTGILTSSHL